MAKPAQKAPPQKTPLSDTRNLTPKERRELFLKARAADKPDYQVLTKDWYDELIPYGMVTFDYVLGLGGISRHGRVSQVHGDEGVGKSTLTYQIAKNYQEFTGEPLGVFDFEGTGTPGYLESIGADLDMVKLLQPDCMEDSVKETLSLIDQGCRFFIYDSIPWIDTLVDKKDIMSGKAFKSSYGKQAQVMTKFFKLLHPHVKRADGHMFMVNQTRARIDDSREAEYASDYSYTNKTYVLPGGRICRFTPSVMVELRMVKEVVPLVPGHVSGSGPDKDPFVVEPATPETEGKPCATRIRARTLKNKVTGAGFRQGYLWQRPTTYGGRPGFDENMSVRELARDHGLIQNKGAKWFVGPSPDAAIAAYPNKDAAVEDLVVRQNPEVLAKLRELVIEAVRADGGRYAAEVDPDEVKFLEGDEAARVEEVAPAGGAFAVEEA